MNHLEARILFWALARLASSADRGGLPLPGFRHHDLPLSRVVDIADHMQVLVDFHRPAQSAATAGADDGACHPRITQVPKKHDRTLLRRLESFGFSDRIL